MHRFFLSSDCIQGAEIRFPPAVAHQMVHVLRLRHGDRVMVLDNQGSAYEVELSAIGPNEVHGHVMVSTPVTGEPSCQLTLYLCLSQREKFEWILQKCTEVGAASFVPVISERSLVQDETSVIKKTDRWQHIIQEAAEQSGRGILPTLSPPLHFNEAIPEACRTHYLALLPWEKEQTRRLRQVLSIPDNSRPKKVAVMIGPEGGFSDYEVELAQGEGFITVTLGPRILRMETAAVVVAALVLYELD